MIDSNLCCSIWLWSFAILFVKADTQSQPEFDRKPPGRRLRKRACLSAESGSCQLFYVLFWILVVRLIHDIQIHVHVGILGIAYSIDEYVYDMHHLLMVTWILVTVGGLLVKHVFHSTFFGGVDFLTWNYANWGVHDASERFWVRDHGNGGCFWQGLCLYLFQKIVGLARFLELSHSKFQF